MITYVTAVVALILTVANAIPQHGQGDSMSSQSRGSSQGEMKNSYFGDYGYGGYGHDNYYARPKYSFAYGVEDKETGDVKSQHEERDGDNTRGYYTVHEPDGTILTVHYTVDKNSGFKAMVDRKGHAFHPQPVKKVAVVAPIVHHVPVVHHVPIVHHALHH